MQKAREANSPTKSKRVVSFVIALPPEWLRGRVLSLYQSRYSPRKEIQKGSFSIISKLSSAPLHPASISTRSEAWTPSACSCTMSLPTPQVQEYWLPGYGLSRNIVLSNIHYFLGPSATVRPYTFQVCISTFANDPYLTETNLGQRRLSHCWHALNPGW